MPWLVSLSTATARAAAGWVKLGQPVPLSNLSSARNNSVPQPAHEYRPGSWSSHNAPVNGRSVPRWRSTRYCSGVSSRRHSSSLFVTFSSMTSIVGPITRARSARPLSRQERAQRSIGLFRRFLRDEVSAVDRTSAEVVGPRTPHLEHIVPGRELTARCPQHQHRPGNLPASAIGLVDGEIVGHGGAIVL